MELAKKMADPGVFALGRGQLWPFMGLWTMQVWIYWANTASIWQIQSVIPWWSVLYGAMTLVMLAAAMIHWGMEPARAGGRFDLPLTALMCAVSVSAQARAWLCPAGAVGVAWGWADAVLGGICMAWGYLRWAAVYARLPIRDAVGCLFASYLLGSTLKILFDVAPAALASLMAFALPLVSFASVRRALACDWPHEADRSADNLYHAGTLSLLMRLVVCVFVFCLARVSVSMTVTQGGNLLLTRTISHLVEVAFAAFALWHVFLRNRSLDFPQLWRFVFLFLTTTVLVDCACREAGVSLGIGPQLFSGVGTSLLVMLLWLLLADVAHHSSLHPYVVFGVGWSLYVGANCLGPVALRLLGVTALTPMVGLVLAYAMGTVMVFCLETRDADVQRIFADMRKKVAPEEFATIDERCESLARQFDLTEREVEVMKLLAKGRSKSFIAEELYLSENTVRGHAKHLYAKLDIHTKAELQDLVGA